MIRGWLFMDDVQAVYDLYLSTPEKGQRMPTYYMTNLGHPVINQLWRVYCKENGIISKYPASDGQRTAFELWLLRPEIAKVAREYAEEIRRAKEEKGHDFVSGILEKNIRR